MVSVLTEDTCAVCDSMAFARCRRCAAKGTVVLVCDTICAAVHAHDHHNYRGVPDRLEVTRQFGRPPRLP